jgi:hypothetical protein
MKKTLMILIAIVQTVTLYGQVYKTTGKLSEIINYKISGYSILDTVSGDLNRDSYKDLIIVYRKDNEDKTSDINNNPVYRPLLIYIGQSDGTLKLTAQNEKAVLCYDCGGMMGDPFSQIVIKNGYFTIEHYGGSAWRWSRLITFKYSNIDSTWYLHKDGGDSFHASDPEKVTTKVRTTKDFGVIPFEKFDVFKENE